MPLLTIRHRNDALMSPAAPGSVLLIGGHVRSGTTLIRRLCDGHPDMAITNEYRFFSALGQSYASHSRFMLREGWREVRRRQLGLRERLLVRACYLWKLRKHQPPFGVVDASAVGSALHEVFPRERIVGDKAPFYVMQLGELAPIQQLSLLIILRDARDVVSSTLERVRTTWRGHWKIGGTAENLARRWVRCAEQIEYHRHRVRVICYEELVRDPRLEMKRLGEWLDVDPDRFPLELIHGSSVGKYKQGLTRDELDTVMQIAGPAMERHGYRS